MQLLIYLCRNNNLKIKWGKREKWNGNIFEFMSFLFLKISFQKRDSRQCNFFSFANSKIKTQVSIILLMIRIINIKSLLCARVLSISLWKWPTKNEASWLAPIFPFCSLLPVYLLGFPGGAVVKNPPAMQEMWDTWVRSLGQKIPWRRKWWPTSVFLPGESHGQRRLAGYSPWESQRVGHD